MNIFFKEWNYKTNGESPAFTVHTLLECPLRCPSTVASFCSSSIAGYCFSSLGRVRGTTPHPPPHPQPHSEEATGREAKSQMRAVVTALSPPPAGCDSAVPAWEPVESLVWILCPVCDGARRAGSGFHCHHLYPVFPLVPLPAEAACGSAPPEQPG